jgi:hypothetical protein
MLNLSFFPFIVCLTTYKADKGSLNNYSNIFVLHSGYVLLTMNRYVWRTDSCFFEVEASWNVMAHAQKPDFVFRRNGRVHLNRRGRQFSRLLATKVCASAVVMLDTPRSEVVWKVLVTHSIRQFPLHFPSRASPCAIIFQLESTSSDARTWSIIFASSAICWDILSSLR